MSTVSFELPDSIERQLSAKFGDLGAAAKESLLVEIYRRGQLTQAQFASCLGVTRLEVDAILQRHHVVEDLPTVEEHRSEMEMLKQFVRG